MSGTIYSLEELLAAEARAEAARAANEAERVRTHKRTLKVLRIRSAAWVKRAYRMIAHAMDLVAANLWRGKRRSVAALLLFERQWRRERAWFCRRGLRISGYDAIEQFVRRIRLWRVAGVLR